MFDRTLLITTIAALSWILSIFPNSCTNAQLVNGAFLPLFVDPQPDCSGWTFATSPISTAPIVKVFTVIKPPALGHKPPKSYQTCIPPLIAAGTQEEHTQLVHLLGYVDTQQGQRNPQDVQKDIKTYAGWEEAYRPEGIYFDNVPATAAASGSGYSGEGNLDLYEGYATQVRELFGNTSLVVLNPSTLPDPGYFTFSDLIITVNEDYNTFNFTSFESTNISPTTPASKQIVILYNQTGILEVSPVVDQISAIADVRACFITTEPEATEFDSVPSIWSQLLALLIGSQTA